MKSRHVIVSAVLAVMAISAIGTATASAALPAFFNAAGKEANPGSFTGTSSARVTFKLSYPQGDQIECSNDTITGKFVTSKELTGTTVTWNNCEFQGSYQCHNAGSSTAITSELLKGTLGYLNKETHEVGLRLEAEKETEVGFPKKKVKGPWDFSITCSGGISTSNLEGQLIGVIKPVNTLQKPYTATYSGTSEQSPIKFEGGVKEYLSGSGGIPGAVVVNGGLTLAFANEYEIRA